MQIQMIGFKIVRLELLNRIQEEGYLKLGNNSDFDVAFNQKEGISFATIKQTIEFIGHPEQFHIDLVLEGSFKIEDIKNNIEDRKEAHRRCYEELFPYSQHIVSHLCVDTGMPGLNLPKREMELDQIHCGEKPKSKNGKIIDLK